MSRVLDPVELGILWDRLISIANEVTSTLVRTSFSAVVRESQDLSCVLFDAAGRALAQGTHSIPVFIGTAPQTLRHMLARFPAASLRPGDVLMTNDSWMGAGHVWDVNVARPAFRGDRLVGFVMTITHLPDIGGRGFSAVSREAYEEGLQIPICKLVDQGRLDDELIELIRANVRVDAQVIGDLMANLTATQMGCRQLAQLMDEYGLASLDPLADAIIGQSGRAMARAIGGLRDGSYANAILIEGFDRPVRLACRVTVAGERLAIDFAGTDGPVRAATNVPLCYTRAMAIYAVKCLLLPSIPNNEGALAAIAVTAPPGCLLNVDPPAATGARAQIGHFVVSLVLGTLADLLPDTVPADAGMINMLSFQGSGRDDRPFAALYFSTGGFGGQRGQDGVAALSWPTNISGSQTETWEEISAMRVLCRELRCDSGGAGEQRGGLGQRIRLRNDTGHDLTMFGFGVRTEHAAPGARGGRPGLTRRFAINDADIHPKDRHVLRPGDVLEIEDAGGGGWGEPGRRSADAIRADLAEGFVTPAAALRDYGWSETPS